MAEKGGGRSRVGAWLPAAAGRRRDWIWLDRLSRAADRLAAWLTAQVAAELARSHFLAWIAVAFGAGIAAYFAAEREPSLWAALPAASVLVTLAVLARRTRYFHALAMVAAIAAGFATATAKTARIDHPVLASPVFSVTLAGFVESREERERSDRLVLRINRFEPARSTDAAQAVERVRLSVKKGTAPAVGSLVELKARLSPPFTALRPGGYDFARDIYFQKIGASGFVLGAIRPASQPEAAPERGWWLRYATAINGLRDAIDARMRQSLSGDTRAIATALLTGKRDAISPPVNDAMFVSGLGHVLSISGYHMAIVAGVVFFAVRALLALFPALTVGFPIKKWAAGAALAAATFYLALSGAEVATQRSFLMTAVVLIGVMADRRAITFRTLAVAAMVVMVIAPEAVVHPSFQMSFAATLGLVALMDRDRALFALADNTRVARAALWGGREIALLALASLVAGLATMPYAAFHFNRATPYGLLANLAAMPVVSGVVMPAGLAGLLAMPFGFDSVFWRVMDWGIQWMILVAQWVESLPGSVGRVPAFGTGPLLLATLGIIIVAMLRTPLRWCGGIVALLAVALALNGRQPDILIAADGRSVAVRGDDGRLRLMQTKKDAFVARAWLGADADARSPDDPNLTRGAGCDEAGCAVKMADGRYVTIALRADAFDDDCKKAAVIVTDRQPPTSCEAMVFDRERREALGSVALTGAGPQSAAAQTVVADGAAFRSVAPNGLAPHAGRSGRWEIHAVRPPGTDRPWARAHPAANVTSQPRPAVASPQPAVDATPATSDLSPEDQ
ncbi:MAG: ComEC/Rec2 family competence protein [Xanthobacteraceae bacterium]